MLLYYLKTIQSFIAKTSETIYRTATFASIVFWMGKSMDKNINLTWKTFSRESTGKRALSSLSLHFVYYWSKSIVVFPSLDWIRGNLRRGDPTVVCVWFIAAVLSRCLAGNKRRDWTPWQRWDALWPREARENNINGNSPSNTLTGMNWVPLSLLEWTCIDCRNPWINLALIAIFFPLLQKKNI